MEQVLNRETLKGSIRSIEDFPKEGILFRDITTLLKEKRSFNYVIDLFTEQYKDKGISRVVAIESRGFILGGAIAHRLGAGFVPIRKPGKLPADVYSRNYQLEYGEDSLEIHKDALESGDTILLHDDLLATGGTTVAALDLIHRFGVQKVFISYLVELDFLNGKDKLKNYEIFSLIHF
ncbi:MAG: adenine phosphoribosyltransferase [Bacteroidales bacterium]|nr:adenine phosphoribosyltransferase [Bacteroidales bacterium]